LKRVLCVGECMVELRHVDETTARIGYAGDTYNTAVYLRRVARELRLEIDVGYLSGLGDDAYSAAIRAAWQTEGIQDRAFVVPGKAPGLYSVRIDDHGERSFTYWRSDSAARSLLSGVDWTPAVDGDLVYLSGITLQLLTEQARRALIERIDDLRAAGTTIALDTNYRAQGWPSPTRAAAAIDQATARAHIVFSTLEDEQALHGLSTAEPCVARLRSLGASETLVKAGAQGVWLTDAYGTTHLPAVPPAHIVDTTAAGDALAGGYLAARLAGRPTREAVRLGMHVAAVVIAHAGALTPAGMPLLDRT
jgi:2-dehydro-3-deoxygluconokinase